jgi:uroporphyrin-III C-methyltransferase/precorrin-2 dehydrogenase/sirohydrochlorin ferrochelatase
VYPVMLSLSGRPVLVVGGGEVALRKVEGLLAEGAKVTAVAPEVVPALDALAGRGEIELRRRAYREGDAAGFALVFAATDDRAVNARVSEEGRARGIWVNVADDPELCTFHLPARVQRGALQLAVASRGGAPFVVRRLRQVLERRFGAEWAEWIEAAARFRQDVRDLDLARADAERRFDAFFTETVDVERLRARVPTDAELATWLAPPRDADAATGKLVPLRRSATPRARAEGVAAQPALVSLVGAGPGDAGLLTVRAKQRLRAARAIVYDRLAEPALPCDLGPDVELHCVGKEAGHHSVPQEETNALLVRLAREGKRTVRLKGGDPFVFGRGSEEAEALIRAGVPWEVVPGVTAALGATACAGIPVTHRGESVRVTLVTARESAKGDGPQVRWDLLAQDRNATLVGYMGVSRLPEVAEKLVAAGMPPSTPAALVAQGSMAGQRTVVSTLAGLHDAGVAAGIHPPALFVIGPTVRHAAALGWFASRPLSGERLGIFAPAADLGAALDVAGAQLLEAARPLPPAARVALGAAPLTGWILRSASEVDAVEDDRAAAGLDADVRAYCLGREAADRARSLGWGRVVELGEGGGAEELLAAVADAGLAAALGGRGNA